MVASLCEGVCSYGREQEGYLSIYPFSRGGPGLFRFAPLAFPKSCGDCSTASSLEESSRWHQHNNFAAGGEGGRGVELLLTRDIVGSNFAFSRENGARGWCELGMSECLTCIVLSAWPLRGAHTCCTSDTERPATRRRTGWTKVDQGGAAAGRRGVRPRSSANEGPQPLARACGVAGHNPPSVCRSAGRRLHGYAET